MVLELHTPTMKKLKNPGEVVSAIANNVEGRGVYFIPGDDSDQAAKVAAFKSGPVAFISVRPGARESWTMTTSLIRGLTANIAAALVLAMMLSSASHRLNYLGRVMFVVLGGIFVCIAGIYPNSIWWEFPNDFILITMLDSVVGWLIAGIIMAALIKPRVAKAD